MALGRLILRSLLFYRRTGIAAAFGLVVATAVITGSLLIGDSMRGSLRDTALSRLGHIDYALSAPLHFRDALAADLLRDRRAAAAFDRIAPLLQTAGATREAETQAVAPNVTVYGVDPGFGDFFGLQDVFELTGRDCLVSAALARDLGLAEGKFLLLNIHKQSAVPSESLFARRALKDTAPSLRLRVKAVLPDGGAGDFRLDAQSGAPRNVFVSRTWLAARLGAEKRANVLVAASKPGSAGVAEVLEGALKSACKLPDYGLRVTGNGLGGLSLSSDATLLPPSQVTAATDAASACGGKAARVSVYLATRIAKLSEPGSAGIAYAMMAGVEPSASALPGAPLDTPARSEVWLNSWAASDLRAAVGDMLEVSYLVPTNDGAYPTAKMKLRLARIVDLSGEFADRTLVPEFKGLTDAARMTDWKPPFPVDLGRITPRDEEYWSRYRATPKVFVNLGTAQALWQKGPEGAKADSVTSIRIMPPRGVGLAGFSQAFVARLLSSLPPGSSGLAFRPVREIAVAASQGTSDFGQLFLGLSMFIVFSGMGLAGMLLRVSLDSRASQAGIMLATGVPRSLVRTAMAAEGMLLTVVGVLVGVPAGVGYAAVIIQALTRWWNGAIGSTPSLWLHVTAQSLAVGAASGLAVGLLTVLWSTRALTKLPVLRLLGGQQALAVSAARRRSVAAPAVLVICLVGALWLWIDTARGHSLQPQAGFFGIGCCLLVAGLAAVRVLSARALQGQADRLTFTRLAIRNVAGSPGSLLVVGLLACAAFVLVAVAANTRDLSRADWTRRDSGSGGFALLATSSIPLPYDLGAPEGRANLGFSPQDEAAMAGTEVIGFLSSGGEDISCLNLARPSAPRILGVPPEMVKRGGFSIVTKLRTLSANSWELLRTDKYVPAFGDASSVVWNLHSGLGKQYIAQNGLGADCTLQFVGLLQGSVFARELLVSEDAFRGMFPGIARPSYFLIATPPGREREVAEVLRRNLGEVGLDVRTTGEVLNEFLRVQNTYLSVFLALGGLGLALGTVGVVIVLLRAALQRRGEFALMSAAGFAKGRIVRLLLVENGSLMLAGLGLGAGCALAAVAPQLASADSSVNWSALLVVLLAVVAVGLCACIVAVSAAVRGNLVETLRQE